MGKRKIETEQGLGTIRFGELDYYYPLKFDTGLGYVELCHHIADSVADMFSTCELKAATSLRDDIKAKIDGKDIDEEDRQSHPDCLFDGATLTLNPSETLSLSVQLGCTQAFLERDERFDFEYSEFKKVYGSFVSMHQRVILPPLHVRLVNGRSVWLYAILLLFRNKMGVLKLELPLMDVPIDNFKDFDHDGYVSSVVGGCIAPCWRRARRAFASREERATHSKKEKGQTHQRSINVT